ncbi:hypothetical protein B1400_0434 [Bifidobacterium italicum]|uniref:NADPH-dependent FMN reductase n=1 Tax=Bifidobacterium italicum TaxID=1960968 RepID=A0A2A2EL66_9BIFI|nr:hypothetical protein B1400_0434 [Bifidobacterium italicum]
MRTTGTRTPLPVEQPAHDLGVVLQAMRETDTIVIGSPVYRHDLGGMGYMGMARDEREARTLAGKL